MKKQYLIQIEILRQNEAYFKRSSALKCNPRSKSEKRNFPVVNALGDIQEYGEGGKETETSPYEKNTAEKNKESGKINLSLSTFDYKGHTVETTEPPEQRTTR